MPRVERIGVYPRKWYGTTCRAWRVIMVVLISAWEAFEQGENEKKKKKGKEEGK